MIKCFSCKSGEMSPSTATYIAEAVNCIVIIKNVPCVKCGQCGEVLYNTDTLKKIEAIVKSAEQFAMEISVIDYAKAA